MKRDEQGIALVITLFLMATLSALAVSMMFLAQTETASSRNYRTMSQARYAAEAGVHKAANYLLNSYTAPSTTTNFNAAVSPVTCTGSVSSGCAHPAAAGATCNASTVATAISTGCVVLTGITGQDSNYPDTTVVSGFKTAATGTLAVNSAGSTTNAAAGTVTYGAAAILMSMRAVTPYGGVATMIQTWQIVSDGTVPPSTAAIVEVSGVLEREFGTADTFTVFATGNGCGAIDLGGNLSTESTNDGTTVVNSGGNVGTNGNLNMIGSVDVHGSLSSPRVGVGSCTSNNVTALETGGHAQVDNNAVVKLPQALTFPTPAYPTSLPALTTMSSTASNCTLVHNANPGIFYTVLTDYCSTSGSTTTITPPASTTVNLGNISGNWALNGGSYNINSIGSGNISIPAASGSVTVNLVGRLSTDPVGGPYTMADPFDLNAQAVVNSTNDASKLQVLYAGTGTINMTGGSNASMLLYAPNAHVETHGNADIWGSILVASLHSNGNQRLIYDNRLKNKIVTLGSYMMTAFSWKKY